MKFEKLKESDLPLLFSWLNSPHLIGIYDQGYSSLEELKAKYFSGQVDRYLVRLEGNPLGYIQSYGIDSHHPYVQYRAPQGTSVGIDLFIGDPSLMGKGYGFEVLCHFIRFLGRGIDRVIADPQESNLRSIGLFNKYGFKEVGKEGLHRIVAIDIRYTSRGLILNEKNELLLMKVEDDITIDTARPDNHFWVTVGGSIEKGETPIEALAREMVEEIGLENFTIGKLTFYGEHTLLFHHFPVRHFEQFYLVRAGDGQIHHDNLTPNEKKVFRGIRWWSLQELSSTREVFYPRSLAKELQDLRNIPREIIL